MSSGTLELTNTSDGIYISGNAVGNAVHGLIERLTLKIKPTFGFGIKALFGFNDSFQIGPEVRLQRFENTAGGKLGIAGLEARGTYTTTTGEMNANGDAVGTKPTVAGTNSTVLSGTDSAGEVTWGATTAGVQEITVQTNGNNATNTNGVVTIDLNGATLFTDEQATVYTVDTKKTTQTETFFGVAIVGKLNDKLSVTAGYNMATAKQHEFKVDSTMTVDASRQMTGTETAVDKFNLETKKPKVHNCYAGVLFSF